jgi:hypothetical protein
MVAATDRKTRGGRVQRLPDRFIFIDFQDTGRGHVFQDFVAFESSVRMNYGRDGSYIYAAKGEEDVANKQLSPQQFLQWECQLARLVAGTELNEGPQLFRLIAQIRSMARRNFPTEDWNTYLYASAIHHFRLLRLGGNDEHQQGRLTAAVIASLNELRVRTGH